MISGNKLLKFVKRTILVTALILISADVFGGSLKIRIALNHAPPFRVVDGCNCTGIYCDIIRSAAHEIDADLEFIRVPFKRALIMMKTGDADMMLGPNKNPERESYMVYLINAPLPRADKAFYVSPDSTPIQRYEDLYKKTIGVLRGAVHSIRFDKDTAIKRYKLNSYESGIRMVLARRIEVIIMPEFIGDYTLRKLGINLKKSSYLIKGNISYFTISKKSSLISKMKIIEEALMALAKKGIIQDIINRYK